MLTIPLLIAVEASSVEIQRNNALFLAERPHRGNEIEVTGLCNCDGNLLEIKPLFRPGTYNHKLPY